MPRVTLIVPVYNVERYLRRCMDSILAQTYKDFEVICVDDCSQDYSARILAEYQERYPAIVSVLNNQENIGQGRSRVRALQRARGEYISFVDSDDHIRRDYLERYVHKMDEGNYELVIGGYTRDIGGKRKKHYVSQSDWSVLTYTIACAKMYRKDFLMDHAIDFSDKRQGEDIYFCLMVYYHIKSYAVIPYTGYYYHLNSSSTTGSMDHKAKFEKTVAEMFDSFMAKNDLRKISLKKRRFIEYDYMAQMINALITYGHGGGLACMREKYDLFREDRERRFPHYRKNPYWNFFRIKGQTVKIRLAVSVVMLADRLGLERLLFYVISLIGSLQL